jgi:hypothetical protein
MIRSALFAEGMYGTGFWKDWEMYVQVMPVYVQYGWDEKKKRANVFTS